MAALTRQSEKIIALSGDVEKGMSSSSVDAIPVEGRTEELSKPIFWSRLYDNDVEFHGGAPIPVEAQTDTRYFNVFTVYSTSMFSLLP
jgi:hypothetical protein